MTGRAEWQAKTGSSWAAEWQRTDRSFAALTAVLLDRILAKGAAHSILDIGCGAGELSLLMAEAKPGARVLGVDVSADLVAAANARVPDGARISFVEADAAIWQDAWFYPDLLVSRHGVMFFDDPVAAFANLADASAEGARLVFSCFRSPKENSWAAGIGKLLPDTPQGPADAPGPFAFADQDRVRGILESGGWQDARFEPVDFHYVAGGGDDPVADALGFFSLIGPAAKAMRALEGEAQTAFQAGLRALVEANRKADQVAFDAAAWIVTARKAD